MIGLYKKVTHFIFCYIKEILKSAGISLNEVLDVTVSNGVITLVKPFFHKILEERAAEFNGKLMLNGEYDWGKPVGREVL